MGADTAPHRWGTGTAAAEAAYSPPFEPADAVLADWSAFNRFEIKDFKAAEAFSPKAEFIC